MTRSIAMSLLVCGALFANAAPSSADTITFDNSSLHTGGAIAVGSQVSLTGGVIDAVAKTSTTLGFNITGTCGVGAIYGCITITTGNFVGPDTSSGSNDYLYMGAGSNVTVTGGIASLGLTNGTALFSGAFDPNANVILTFDDSCQPPTVPSQCTGYIQGTLTLGSINPTLATALGISPSSTGGGEQSLFFAFSGITLPVGTNPSGTASLNTNQLQVITPAVTVNPTLGEVPEPGTLLLLGSGLLFAAKFARRRKA